MKSFLVLGLAISCASFGSMHGVFMTTVENIMVRVKRHSDLDPTAYERVESTLAGKSRLTGWGQLLLLTPEILDEIKAEPGIRTADLMTSFLLMAQLWNDEKIIHYLQAHGAVLEMGPEVSDSGELGDAGAKAGEALVEAGEGKEEN